MKQKTFKDSCDDALKIRQAALEYAIGSFDPCLYERVTYKTNKFFRNEEEMKNYYK